MSEQSSPPVWNAKRLRAAIDAAGVALWSWNVETDQITLDESGYDLWGLPKGGHVTFEDLSAHIHPQDLDRVRAAFAATRAVVGAYEIDFRIMLGDEIRWISARGQGNDAGVIGQFLFGIFLDVTGRKQAEEAHELLAGEMSHRVKNLLHIASALALITSRTAATTEELVRNLTRRLTALGRAHDLVRPIPGQEGEQDGQPRHIRAARRLHRIRLVEGGRHRHAANEQGPPRDVSDPRRKGGGHHAE